MAYPSTVREIEDGLGALAAAHPALCTRTTLPNADARGPPRVRRARHERRDDAGALHRRHARPRVGPARRAADAPAAPARRLRGRDRPRRSRRSPTPPPTPDIPYAGGVDRGRRRQADRRVRRAARRRAASTPTAARSRSPGPPTRCGARTAARRRPARRAAAWTPTATTTSRGTTSATTPRRARRTTPPRRTPATRRSTSARRRRPSPRSATSRRSCASSDIAYFVDVHSFSRKLLYPWGMDGNQTRDPSQNYENPAWDGRRDGTTAGPYGEYIPAAALERHVRVGTAMHDAIVDGAGSDRRARVRSEYAVEPSLALYPTTGTFSDFAFTVKDDRVDDVVHARVRQRRRRRGRLSARARDLSEDRARGAPGAARDAPGGRGRLT